MGQIILLKANDNEYEVDDGGKVTVKVDDNTCSCEMWKINGFPCPHAASIFIRFGLDMYKHIDPYFWASTFR